MDKSFKQNQQFPNNYNFNYQQQQIQQQHHHQQQQQQQQLEQLQLKQQIHHQQQQQNAKKINTINVVDNEEYLNRMNSKLNNNKILLDISYSLNNNNETPILKTNETVNKSENLQHTIGGKHLNIANNKANSYPLNITNSSCVHFTANNNNTSADNVSPTITSTNGSNFKYVISNNNNNNASNYYQKMFYSSQESPSTTCSYVASSASSANANTKIVDDNHQAYDSKTNELAANVPQAKKSLKSSFLSNFKSSKSKHKQHENLPNKPLSIDSELQVNNHHGDLYSTTVASGDGGENYRNQLNMINKKTFASFDGYSNTPSVTISPPTSSQTSSPTVLKLNKLKSRQLNSFINGSSFSSSTSSSTPPSPSFIYSVRKQYNQRHQSKVSNTSSGYQPDSKSSSTIRNSNDIDDNDNHDEEEDEEYPFGNDDEDDDSSTNDLNTSRGKSNNNHTSHQHHHHHHHSQASQQNKSLKPKGKLHHTGDKSGLLNSKIATGVCAASNSWSLNTDYDEEDFMDAFRVFDTNGDGRITAKELNHVLKELGIKMSKDEIKKMIKELDKDGNGTIEYSEFVNMMTAPASRDADEFELREAFKCIDLDGNGYISREELRDAVKRIMSTDNKIGISDVEEMMKEADTDGNGLIDFEEFVRVLVEKRN